MRGPQSNVRLTFMGGPPAVGTHAAVKIGDLRHRPLAALGESYTEAGIPGRGK